MALLMALMPWRDISPERSPFVRVFEQIGIPGAASLMNLVVLTAALSAINTDPLSHQPHAVLAGPQRGRAGHLRAAGTPRHTAGRAPGIGAGHGRRRG